MSHAHVLRESAGRATVADRRAPGGWMVAIVLGTTLSLMSPALARAQDEPVVQGTLPGTIDYRVLATRRTSTMQNELNQAADEGFRFVEVMGGDTAFGGSEVVAVMARTPETARGRYAYRLLATSKTSTMQAELQDMADAGYHYRGQTVFDTAFGGDEVVVILERDQDADRRAYEYRLFATSRTSTLSDELRAAGAEGFELVGMTVGDTAFRGSELVAITRRERAR